MTERAVFRFVRWTVAPDREPDAEPITYAMQCAVCGMRYAVDSRRHLWRSAPLRTGH